MIDVKEKDEWRIAKGEGTTLLPLSQLAERYTELDPNQSYYLHCKAGVRSLKALEFLRQQGFGELKSVPGGISAWSGQIPSVPLTNSEKVACLGPRTSINQSTRAMGLRREARERAVQFLFQHDMNPVVTEDLPHHLNHFWETHQLSESGYEKGKATQASI